MTQLLETFATIIHENYSTEVRTRQRILRIYVLTFLFGQLCREVFGLEFNINLAKTHIHQLEIHLPKLWRQCDPIDNTAEDEERSWKNDRHVRKYLTAGSDGSFKQIAIRAHFSEISQQWASSAIPTNRIAANAESTLSEDSIIIPQRFCETEDFSYFLWSIRDFEEQIWHKQCDTGSRGWLFYTGNGTIVEQNTELLRFMTIAEVDNQIAHDWERIKQTTSETVRRIELLNFTRVHPLTFVPYIEWRKKDLHRLIGQRLRDIDNREEETYLTKQRAENLEKGLSKGIAKTKLAELVETLTLDDQLREEEENRARTA